MSAPKTEHFCKYHKDLLGLRHYRVYLKELSQIKIISNTQLKLLHIQKDVTTKLAMINPRFR